MTRSDILGYASGVALFVVLGIIGLLSSDYHLPLLWPL